MQEYITVYSLILEMGDVKFSKEHTHFTLKLFFEIIAYNVRMHEGATICHIKGLCIGRGNDFLKASFVSEKGGVNFSGAWSNETDTISLTLNVIVMGIPYQQLVEKVHAGITDMKAFCSVSTVPSVARVPEFPQFIKL